MIPTTKEALTKRLREIRRPSNKTCPPYRQPCTRSTTSRRLDSGVRSTFLRLSLVSQRLDVPLQEHAGRSPRPMRNASTLHMHYPLLLSAHAVRQVFLHAHRPLACVDAVHHFTSPESAPDGLHPQLRLRLRLRRVCSCVIAAAKTLSH